MPKKSDKLDDLFKELQDNFGLDTRFFARKLAMTPQTFYAARVRGFYPKEAEKLDRALHELGAYLVSLKIPDSMVKLDTRWMREKG